MRLIRLYTITKTLLNHGLDKLIPKRFLPWYFRFFRCFFFWLYNKYPEQTDGQRLRLALQGLGPVFIKFGQMLSTRRDLLPPDIADELALLQDKVQPFDGEQAQSIIESALQIKDISEYFDDFATEPLASASIAQVHTATLKEDGKDIVIKVIRPNIAETINADIELMRVIAWVVQKVLPDGRRLRPVEVVEEYRKTIEDELDLLRESANGIQLRKNFEASAELYIPYIYPDLCRQNVLVMERIYGIPIADIETLKAHDTNFKLLAERGVSVFFTQVFRDSFFHADMHPGNIFISTENLQSPQYIAIDFGIVGTLNRDDKRYLAENFVAFFNSDYRKVAELHVDSGWVPADTNIDEFEMAIRTVCEPIFHKPLAEISFGHVLLQLFNTARRFDMVVQPQLVLLQKTLLYIEGLGRQLYPQLDLWETAKPFLEQWMKEQIGLSAMLHKVKNNLPFWSEKLPDVPDLVFDSMKQLKTLPEFQRKLHEDMLKRQRENSKAIVYAVAGGVCFMVAALLPVYQLPIWTIALLCLLGAGAWGKSWVKLYQ
ncbi:MAG: ubiquinone biosynthesis regulatory protein kinase UbiB [Aestuariibacter sp.]